MDESNKGHQLLRKMGWGGAGLGAKEQGIADRSEKRRRYKPCFTLGTLENYRSLNIRNVTDHNRIIIKCRIF